MLTLFSSSPNKHAALLSTARDIFLLLVGIRLVPTTLFYTPLNVARSKSYIVQEKLQEQTKLFKLYRNFVKYATVSKGPSLEQHTE